MKLGDAEAIGVLTGALERLDPTFTRAETALRVDLAAVLTTFDERAEARVHAQRANNLAMEIGSSRLQHRMRSLSLLDE